MVSIANRRFEPYHWPSRGREPRRCIGCSQIVERDGGGSRCRARIENAQGRLLGEGASGPATTRLGVDKAWRSIMRACEAAAEQAGINAANFALMQAGIGIAGLGRRGAREALTDIAHP